MIFLEIFIPALSLSVDVRTKDSRTVMAFIGEVCDLVRQKVGESESENKDFVLYAPSQNRILPKNASLRDCGLMSGSKVMLL